tara:strand:- start:26 stop:322 length:297 start_codon:yes stop_codon:yes gene_type:complete
MDGSSHVTLVKTKREGCTFNAFKASMQPSKEGGDLQEGTPTEVEESDRIRIVVRYPPFLWVFCSTEEKCQEARTHGVTEASAATTCANPTAIFARLQI